MLIMRTEVNEGKVLLEDIQAMRSCMRPACCHTDSRGPSVGAATSPLSQRRPCAPVAAGEAE